MTRAALIRAEGTVVTSTLGTSLVLINQFNSNSNQYEPREITVANLIAGGSDTPLLNLGSSGTAGTLNIFPATASSGNLQFVAGNNSANVITTVTNASQAAAHTYSIPDSKAAATFVMQNKGTGTEASNAVTINNLAGVITTSSLTTAGAATYVITLTNSYIATGSIVLLSIAGGTNTATFNVTSKVVSGSGSAVITLYNNTAATALNGTLILNFFVIP